MSQPKRTQLRRAKGWRMPANTVKVDRSTKWGNPFVVGLNGMTREGAMHSFRCLMAGYINVSCGLEHGVQERYHEHVRAHIGELRGKDLACWCRADQDCHADVLLELANQENRHANEEDEEEPPGRHAAQREGEAARRAVRQPGRVGGDPYDGQAR